MVLPFGLYLLIGEYTFYFLIAYFPVVLWLTISYLIREESKSEQAEVYNELGEVSASITPADPITWKEALSVGARWVGYTAGVCIVAILLLSAISYFNSELPITAEQSPELATEQPTTPTAPAVSESASSTPEGLSACQLYYRDVFPNATEYGTFDEYPVRDHYSGPIATVDEDSHGVAKRFYSYHVAALERGVTFAGRYAVSDWAFTGIGQMFAVIDVATGKVYPFPYVVDWDFSYQADSNLIIINPKDSMPKFHEFGPGADFSCESKWFDDMKTYYFTFENNEFKLLGPEDQSGLQTSSWLEDAPMTR
jgi:hypothetical protein